MSFASSNITQPLVILQDGSGISALYILSALVVSFYTLFAYSNKEIYPNIPRVGPKGLARLTWTTQKVDFVINARERLREGSERYPDRPYKIFTDMGDILVIPPHYMEELKLLASMDFKASASDVSQSFCGPFRVDTDLEYRTCTHSLIGPLSLEACAAVEDNLKASDEYYEISLDTVSLLVSRMGSRVFMGPELSADPRWPKASTDYVQAAFATAYLISIFPRVIRPYISWLLPPTYLVRHRMARCQAILKPHIDNRAAAKAAAAARGEPDPYNSSIEWFERECSPDHNPTDYQITLNLVAIHTTSDLLFQALIDIAKHPEIIAPLREELINVLPSTGLNKAGLSKLELMDSCFKETQRCRPVATALFRRLALSDVKLSDGFVVKKGSKVIVDANRLQSPELYEDPDKWDPYRFMRLRRVPGEEGRASLVSSTQSHFGFGYGIHACPGRFFAANLVKVAMAHLLLKYDFAIPEGQRELGGMVIGSNHVAHPKARLLIKSRRPEIDIDSLPI
ncbi:hypothetical protein MCOR25_008326 [Pyricularia grisea]|nr:hypothetical protein MCOR25_008326 [Pyricularia grisea]